MSPFCNVGYDMSFMKDYRFGSARAVNRRYISDCVPAKFTLQASAAFVSASALGMATGPALAGLLEVHTSQFGITLNANTLPGWIMAGGWFLFLLWLWLGFKEPSHHDLVTPSSHSSDICEDICCLGLCLLLWHCCRSLNFIIPLFVLKWLMVCFSLFVPPAGSCVEHRNIILSA
jgi:MFS family permease